MPLANLANTTMTINNTMPITIPPSLIHTTPTIHTILSIRDNHKNLNLTEMNQARFYLRGRQQTH